MAFFSCVTCPGGVPDDTCVLASRIGSRIGGTKTHTHTRSRTYHTRASFAVRRKCAYTCTPVFSWFLCRMLCTPQVEDIDSYRVVLIFKDPAEALVSRYFYNHCKNLRGAECGATQQDFPSLERWAGFMRGVNKGA